MATSHSCIKCFISTCEIILYCIWWLKFCNLYMKQAVSQKGSIKEVFWKTSQNSQISTRSSHPEVFCQKKRVLQDFAKFTEKQFCRIVFFNTVAGWKLESVRTSHWRCSVKQGILKNFANSTGKNLCWSLFLVMLQFWGAATLLKKTLAHLLSCEI